MPSTAFPHFLYALVHAAKFIHTYTAKKKGKYMTNFGAQGFAFPYATGFVKVCKAILIAFSETGETVINLSRFIIKEFRVIDSSLSQNLLTDGICFFSIDHFAFISIDDFNLSMRETGFGFDLAQTNVIGLVVDGDRGGLVDVHNDSEGS